MLIVVVGEAQTPAPPKSPGPKKAASSQPSVASLDAQAQLYWQLLHDPDNPPDSDAMGPLFSKYVEATCSSKRLKYQQAGIDKETASTIYQNCTSRMLANRAAVLVGAPPAPPPAALAATSTAPSVSNTPQPQGTTKSVTPSSTNPLCTLNWPPAMQAHQTVRTLIPFSAVGVRRQIRCPSSLPSLLIPSGLRWNRG